MPRPPVGGLPPELDPPVVVPPTPLPAAGVEGVGDGLDDKPTGGKGGLGVTAIGTVGVGTDGGVTGGTLGVEATGDGTTGVGRAGRLGVTTGSVGSTVGSGVGSGKPVAETCKSTAVNAADVPQPEITHRSIRRRRVLSVAGRRDIVVSPLARAEWGGNLWTIGPFKSIS
jgi:hypothetical protein